jgi:hypothetical protein
MVMIQSPLMLVLVKKSVEYRGRYSNFEPGSFFEPGFIFKPEVLEYPVHVLNGIIIRSGLLWISSLHQNRRRRNNNNWDVRGKHSRRLSSLRHFRDPLHMI